MGRTVRISGGLYGAMLFAHSHVTQFLYLPPGLFREARQDAWIAVLLASVGTIGFTLLCTWLALQAGGQSIFRFARQALGKWAGGFVAFLYGFLFLTTLSLVLRNVQDFVLMVLLPGTPGTLIILLMGLVALYAVHQGIEPIARYSFLAFLLAVVTLASLPLLLMRDYSGLQVDPLFYYGWLPVIRGAVSNFPRFADTIVVLSLVPHLSKRVNAYRWTLIGVGGGHLALTETIALMSLVFGPVLPSRFLYAGYEILTIIAPTEVVERIQVAVVIIWLLVAFVKVTLCLYAAAEGGAVAFGLKSHKGAAVVVTLLAVGLAQIWSGVLQHLEYSGSPPVMIATVIAEVIIIVMLMLAVWRARSLQRCAAGG